MTLMTRVIKKNNEIDVYVKLGNIVRLFVYVFLLLAILITVRISGFSKFFEAEGIKKYIEGAEAWGPLIFIFIYTLTACLSLPTLPITALSGIVYGPVLGTALSLIGANCGAIISFWIARYFARGYVKRLTKGRFSFIEENLKRRGWLFLACVRTVPIFPFALINYSFGLMPLSFSKYAIISFIFMIPSTFVYVCFGISGKEFILSWFH